VMRSGRMMMCVNRWIRVWVSAAELLIMLMTLYTNKKRAGD
jgi:hypothetical protein